MAESQWQDDRTRAAQLHAAQLARVKAQRSQQAQQLIDDFLVQVKESGPAAEEIRATSHHGKFSYRTGLRGWYVRVDKRCAVDEQGRFYVLTIPGSLRERISGVSLEPTPPPLIIGEGSRDGDSIDMSAALQRVLDQGGKG